MVELAWVEREAKGFVVRRAQYRASGETLEMETPRGRVVLVVSDLAGSRLDDATVLTTVASSLLRTGEAVSPSNLN